MMTQTCPLFFEFLSAVHDLAVGVGLHSDGRLAVNTQITCIHAYDVRPSATAGRIFDGYRCLLRMSDRPQSVQGGTSFSGSALASVDSGSFEATTSPALETTPFPFRLSGAARPALTVSTGSPPLAPFTQLLPCALACMHHRSEYPWVLSMLVVAR
jgi:hypothetical protein